MLKGENASCIAVMIISACLMVIGIKAYSHNEQGCLTWEIRRNRLILTCRLTNLSKQVYLIDNHEQEYIRCTLKEKINSCISPHATQSIFVNSSINAITLTIRKIDKNNVEGKWKCKQGKHAYETEVSGDKGIISATDIHLNGEILNTGTTQKVKLKCYSCREPRHKYAEFLINGTSTDGISYNKTSDKCSNQYGECKPHVCSCHRSGNEFINIFNVTNVFGTYYSCEMRFNDNDKKSIFSMERTVYVNGTVFYSASEIKLIKPPSKGSDRKIKTEESSYVTEKENMFDNGSEIVLTKPPPKGNNKKIKTEDPDVAWVWHRTDFLLVVLLTFPAFMIVYCIFSLLNDKEKYTTDPVKLKKDENENSLLLGNVIEDIKVSSNPGKEDKCMQEETFTNENAKQDMEMEKLTDTRMHKKALANGNAEQDTDANGNAEQDTETNKGLHSQDNQDAKDRMTDILHHDEIGETIITAAEQSLKTEADTSQKNRDTMSKQSENNFDQQKEKVIEAVARLDSTQHKIGMEITYTKDTGNIQIYEDKKSPLLGKDLDVSTNSGTEGNTDGKAKMTDFLNIEIEVAIITVVEQTLETEADTKQNEMAKQSGNNVDEQKEEAIEAVDLFESTQHGLGTEFIYIKGTKNEGNLKKMCQPCQKNSNNVPACHWCLNCEEAVCECCKENHSQEHKLEKITPLHNVIKISNWCGNHHDRQYQYFCKDHYSLCCVECKLTEHRGCLDIPSIADASKGFKLSEEVSKYKRVLNTISKSFDDLKDSIQLGRDHVKQSTSDLHSELVHNCHLLIEGDQLQRFKELFPKHVKDARDICLSKLQIQLSVVYKCKSYINTIERSIEQCPEEQLFRLVHISIKFLESTLKKVIRDSEDIKLVFNPMLVGSKILKFRIRGKEKVIKENLTTVLKRKRVNEYRKKNLIIDCPNFH